MNDDFLINDTLRDVNQNKKIVVQDAFGNSKYTLPKNAKKLDPSIYSSLSPEEKKQYDKTMSRPKKVGYAIIHKKFNRFYRISILDFIPFFIGTFISFIRFCVGYGDLKSQLSFDKKMLWDVKSTFILGCVYTFFIVPLLLLLLFFVYPFLIMNDGGTSVTKAWNRFVETMTTNGINSLGLAINHYLYFSMGPVFTDTAKLTITLVLFFLVSTINTKTFLYAYLLRQKREWVFDFQKQNVKEEIVKLKVVKK